MKFEVVDAQNYSLPIHKVLDSCPQLLPFINLENKKIDLGNPEALRIYNECLYKILDRISIIIPSGNLIPTAGLRRAIADLVLKYIQPEKILEIGTGSTAILAQLFALKNIKVFATEISSDSINLAKKQINFNIDLFLHPIKLFQSPGGLLEWLRNEPLDIFPVDVVIFLPPYYSRDVQSKRNRGFQGVDTELYSSGSAEQISIQYIKEAYSMKNFIRNIVTLWKSSKSFEKAMSQLIISFKEIKLFQIKSGTRNRILSIFKV